jgi:hypothetical protein
MISHIIIPGGAPEKGWGDDGRGATPRRLPARLATRTKASLSAAAADLKSMGCASTRKILVSVRYPVVRDRLRRYVTTGQPIPLNLVGGKAPRSLTFLGNAPLKLRQKSSGSVSQAFQPSNSFRVAPGSCLQDATGATHGAGTTDHERGFFSQGETHG